MASIRSTFTLLCGVLGGALAPPSQAASLGEIEVRSSLSSPLLAVLEGGYGALDASGVIDVSIVDPTWAADPGLRALVRERPEGRQIVITSARPVEEPMFTLRLQLRADNVLLTREYPVILDPPRGVLALAPAPAETPVEEVPEPPAQPAVAAAVPAPQAAMPTRSAQPVPSSSRPAPFDERCSLTTIGETRGFDPARDVYGPVTDGESLRLVALRVRPWRECAPLQVVMESLYRHNTGAFYGAPDRLRAGRMLKVPPAGALRTIAADLRPQPAPAVIEDDHEVESAPATLPAALALTSLVGTAHAAPPASEFAALEVAPAARPRPAVLRSATPVRPAPMTAPRAAGPVAAQGVSSWTLLLVLSVCAVLFLRGGRTLAWTRSLGARSLYPAAERGPVPVPVPVPELAAGPATAPDVAAPRMSAEALLSLDTLGPLPAAAPAEPAPAATAPTPVVDDPWENLTLQNRRISSGSTDDGIADTSRLVRAGGGAEMAGAAPPQMTEIVDLLKSTLSRQPSRLDLQMKLFEIYHDLRMRHAFQAEARKVAADSSVSVRLSWNALHALWADLAPGIPLLEAPADAPAIAAPQPARPARGRKKAPQRRFADVATEIAGAALERFAADYEALRADPEFLDELGNFAGTLLSRPTPLTPVQGCSNPLGGSPLFLKREDQRGIAPEVDHALLQAIVAQIMGRKRLVTGNDVPGHSLALAMAAARLQIECVVYLRPSELHDDVALVSKLRLLGARVETMDPGALLLADPREAALRDWMSDADHNFLALSLGTGPHPYPLVVSDFRSLLGRETLKQFRSQTGLAQPAAVVAATTSCADGIGFVLPFLQREGVALMFAQARGARSQPGLEREHAWLRGTGRISYVSVPRAEAKCARDQLSSAEGICVSRGDAPALAAARALAGDCGPDQAIVVLVA